MTTNRQGVPGPNPVAERFWTVALDLAERGRVPDGAMALGIRVLLRDRLREIRRSDAASQRRLYDEVVRAMRSSPLAVDTDKANEQHYEAPTDFFVNALGARLKYSCCLYPDGDESLDEAEEKMLAVTARRAGLADGMEILELGCGWGSLTTWMAERFPRARITAVSNSRTQRAFIEGRLRERGLSNVRIITTDVNRLELPAASFDAAVSVEMFEHVRNYQGLFRSIAGWLRPGGTLFAHIFCHGSQPYFFETEGAANWMGREFFSGGVMPSDDLFYHFQDHLVIERHWRVSGTHYEKTARHWLANMDARRDAIMPVLAAGYGAPDAERWFHRWRIFFLACAELWGYRNGREWWVSHYRWRKHEAAG